MNQKTLSIIKPDVLERNLQQQAIEDLKKDFSIIAEQTLHLTNEQAEKFYAIHSSKPFFKDLVANITKGPIIAMILQGENVIEKYRDKIGPTDPKQCQPGHLRHKYGISIDFNSFHGSDSEENAKKEIEQIFGKELAQ